MRQRHNKKSFFKKLGYLLVLCGGLSAASPATAQNAGDVLNQMEPREQASYIAGVIEGLAFSRFLNERPETAGMQCIYDWYYESETDRWGMIEQWLARHPERPAGAMLHVLIGRDCGS